MEDLEQIMISMKETEYLPFIHEGFFKVRGLRIPYCVKGNIWYPSKFIIDSWWEVDEAGIPSDAFKDTMSILRRETFFILPDPSSISQKSTQMKDINKIIEKRKDYKLIYNFSLIEYENLIRPYNERMEGSFSRFRLAMGEAIYEEERDIFRGRFGDLTRKNSIIKIFYKDSLVKKCMGSENAREFINNGE